MSGKTIQEGKSPKDMELSNKKKKRKTLKKAISTLLIVFLFLNIIALFHAYKFTHFAKDSIEKTKNPQKLGTTQKIKTLLFGINNPRPENTILPTRKFETIVLKSNKKIECWLIKVEHSKGTVAIFHGYSGQKSSMLDKSEIFNDLGYNTLLVDFMGSGGSEGNQTTIGFLEAEEVKTCFDYLSQSGEKNIYLFGTSMGAVAIMKALADYKLNPKGIMLECPFGSMYQTVCARFKIMNVPSFPMAGLLVFWGGIENGFWAFQHNPTTYAKSINCPTLLMYGAKDRDVSRKEIDEIFANLKGKKELKIYPNAGHEDYLIQYNKEWTKDIEEFFSF